MNRNDSPRLSNKIYEIVKDIFSKNSLDKFSSEFIESMISEKENFNINISLSLNDNKYYYKGYPSGNYIKLFCKILELWHSHGSFPINFIKIEGLNDQTMNIIEMLNSQTSQLINIFNFIKENSKIFILIKISKELIK